MRQGCLDRSGRRRRGTKSPPRPTTRAKPWLCHLPNRVGLLRPKTRPFVVAIGTCAPANVAPGYPSLAQVRRHPVQSPSLRPALTRRRGTFPPQRAHRTAPEPASRTFEGRAGSALEVRRSRCRSTGREEEGTYRQAPEPPVLGGVGLARMGAVGTSSGDENRSSGRACLRTRAAAAKESRWESAAKSSLMYAS